MFEKRQAASRFAIRVWLFLQESFWPLFLSRTCIGNQSVPRLSYTAREGTLRGKIIAALESIHCSNDFTTRGPDEASSWATAAFVCQHRVEVMLLVKWGAKIAYRGYKALAKLGTFVQTRENNPQFLIYRDTNLEGRSGYFPELLRLRCDCRSGLEVRWRETAYESASSARDEHCHKSV